MKGLKYEKSYLNIYEYGTALYTGLNGYFKFYNNEGLNQSLESRGAVTVTPARRRAWVAVCGRASIVVPAQKGRPTRS
jgi:hypothetical protein